VTVNGDLVAARILPQVLALTLAAAGGATPSAAQQPDSTSVVAQGDSISVHFVDVDVRAAVQALAHYIDRPVVFGAINPSKVTLETPHAVSRQQAVTLLRGLLDSQGLELVADSGFFRVRQREQSVGPPPRDATNGAAGAIGPIELFVIRLRHARAADVAATVNALYGRASALGETNTGPPSTLDQQLRQQQVPPAGVSPTGDAAQVIPRPAELTGEITIVPDARSNSLLIRANSSDFELVRAAVDQLDIRPLQALIEVLIVEARRDRRFAFGVDATVQPQHVRGTDHTTIGGSQLGAGLGDFVLRVMHLGSIDLDATLTAAASRGDVKIVSRPVVIAANNEEASILVGSQRPFVQVSRALPTDNAARDQVVQYRDVGTRLVVRPTISQDGYVVLQVTQEVNSATSEVQFDAPVISTRTVRTELLVKDGQTVALGGLTDKQHDVNQGGVPLLSSIPLIGGLFGRSSRQTTETELFLFLTTRVIRTDAEADSLTQPLLKKGKAGEP
jgi:general secretion pathway protein D